MLIEQTLFGEINKERQAIQRCVEFQNRNENNKNIVAFSGGKDSIAVYIIAVKSGIEFTPIYSPTSVDPPELINYIRNDFNNWASERGYPKVIFNQYNKFNSKRCGGKMEGKEITMWTLIGNRALPPTRVTRYCCDELKERTGDAGDTVFTGVRWEESKSRKTQKMVNFYKGKIMVRPIVDFTESEVWELIKKYNIPYCKLYDQGWKRIGCIGCPIGHNPIEELELYPKYKENYIRAFERMLMYRESKGLETKWKSGEEVYNWWIGQQLSSSVNDDQCSMF